MHFIEIKQILEKNDPEAILHLVSEITEEEMKALAFRDRAGYQKLRDLRALDAVERGVSPALKRKDAVVVRTDPNRPGALIVGGDPATAHMSPQERRQHYLKKQAEGRSRS